MQQQNMPMVQTMQGLPMSVTQMMPQMPMQQPGIQQPGMPMQYTGQQPQARWAPPIQNMQVNQFLVQNTHQGIAQNNGPAWASGRPLMQQGPPQGHLQVQPMQQFAPRIHQPPMQQQYQSQAIPPQPQMQMMPQMQQLQQQGQPQQLQYATAPPLPAGAARPPQAPSSGVSNEDRVQEFRKLQEKARATILRDAKVVANMISRKNSQTPNQHSKLLMEAIPMIEVSISD